MFSGFPISQNLVETEAVLRDFVDIQDGGSWAIRTSYVDNAGGFPTWGYSGGHASGTQIVIAFCGVGFYAGLGRNCFRCPEGYTSPKKSTSVSNCTAQSIFPNPLTESRGW
mmetsp:Transcript_6399/g.10111  ORF Transcript_6399/g.10111 Transcript_6399/m.10111 type:complete len:111 (+) Transcript_6399:1315-1647(+)